MKVVITALVAVLTAAGDARAHPVPSDNHDRTILVRLAGEAIEVTYRLEVAETRAILDLPNTETAGINSRRDLHEAFLKFYRSVLPENLDANLDGKPLELTVVHAAYDVTDHYRCDLHLRATWRPDPDKQHTFTFREGNYHDDDVSALRLTIGSAGRLSLLGVNAPDELLIAKPKSELRPGEAERLRNLTATFVVDPEAPRAFYKPTLPPDPDPVRDGPRKQQVALARTAPGDTVAWNKPDRQTVGEEDDNASSDTFLHVLLDTRHGFAMLLLLAAGLGAAHALTPGHGKTLAAAYLVGERGTIWHALFLGLVTTITHTAAVLVLAFLLPVLFPSTARAGVQTALELIGGLLVAGLGLWLLLARLTGQADHVHLGGGHSHSHGMPIGRPGWRGLVILGVSGGIVPCWDAMAILGATISTQRLWMGPPLLLAFSAGLASVLVAIGVLVVQARKWAGDRWKGWSRFRAIERTLPLVSAVVVTAMGLWLCYESVHPSGR